MKKLYQITKIDNYRDINLTFYLYGNDALIYGNDDLEQITVPYQAPFFSYQVDDVLQIDTEVVSQHPNAVFSDSETISKWNNN